MAGPKGTPDTISGRVIARTFPAAMVLTGIMLRKAKYDRQVHEIEHAKPRYPHITVSVPNADPEDILRRVADALRAHGVGDDEVQDFIREAVAGDYGDMLVAVSRWVVTP